MEKVTVVTKVRSPYPFYGVGVFCLVYALVFDLYKWTDYCVLVVLSLIVYYVLSHFIFHEETITNTVDISMVSDEVLFAETKTEALKQINSLKQFNEAIPNEVISENLDEIVKIIYDIIDYLGKHKTETGTIRKVLSYYLPTIGELLKLYTISDDLSNPSEEIKETLLKIEESVKMMKSALAKQYEDLYQKQIVDVNADITVLKTMLQQDGLLQDDIKKEKI